MTLEEICDKRDAMYRVNGDDASIREEMAKMERAFHSGRGDLGQWDPSVLNEIDECFLKNYTKDNKLDTCLFFPESKGNLAKFRSYCDEVDQILRTNEGGAPKYAREYFAYYTIWQMRGFKFPVPLGTATTIESLEMVCTNVSLGLTEVRSFDLAFYLSILRRTSCPFILGMHMRMMIFLVRLPRVW